MPALRSRLDASLPVLAALPELEAVLAAGTSAVLEAPPGAGKSTGVPLALLEAPWLTGKRILMLEPRRLAARAVAARMAETLGEPVGETVGYRMRLDTRVGPRTRIEVVTEGILTRQLQRDPGLEGVGCVIFDEFHERSLQADLGLALVLDARRHLTPELRVLVMSATLDGAAVARLLGNAPRITAAGRSFPVETRYATPLPGRRDDPPLDRAVTATVRRALDETEGDLLVFLPGAGEIRRVAEQLAPGSLPAGVTVLPLYGDLSKEEQDRAVRPGTPGQRRVVLATNIAETSLTIPGVQVVVDSGYERRARFDPATGMGRLERVRISRASADQRRGRAGRLGPGTCYRLWTEAEHRALLEHTPPEITQADLAPLALELAGWGSTDAGELDWLDPPPAPMLAQARELLASLGALDDSGRITPHGREMAALGTHPRLAHLLLKAKAAGQGTTACALAALLGERDLLRGDSRFADADIRTRLEVLGREGAASLQVDAQAVRQVRRVAGQLTRQLKVPESGPLDTAAAGPLLALAYPDRIARNRAESRESRSGRFQLTGGRAAVFSQPQALAGAEFLVIPALDAGDREARIQLAAPLTLADIEAALGDQLVRANRVAWDSREQAVVARRELRLGQLVLREERLTHPPTDALVAAVLAGIRELGLGALPWTPALRQWQARVKLVAGADPRPPAPWPDVSDEALMATLETWLAPWLEGVTRRDHLARVDLAAALHSLLSWEQQRRLEELVPTHLTVPSGSRIAVDYEDGGQPSLSVRLQECFGLADTPCIVEGRVPVLLKLLSPARRPVQVTRDLRSFWATTYHEVKKELKGRYPKHYWPDDPWNAEPTRRVRPR
jgi:ATP-dependent helicase HrpB